MAIKNLQQGVTVIELVIVIAIVSVVSSVLIFNYSGFSTSVSIRNLSQEMALSIRKAQTYATSVQSVNSVVNDTTLFPAYGISFSLNQPTSDITLPTTKRFVLFADIPDVSNPLGDKIYTSDGECGVPSFDSECLESFGIATSDRIIRLCTDITGCASDMTVNVLFRRPSPDALICIVQGSACSSSTPSYLEIVVQSVRGDERTILVWNTGQISVQR